MGIEKEQQIVGYTAHKQIYQYMTITDIITNKEYKKTQSNRFKLSPTIATIKKRMQKISHKLLTKLIECILQSRINIEKKQIRHFDEINKQIINYRYKGKFGGQDKLDTFLNSILLNEKFKVHQLIQLRDSYQVVNILFKLRNVGTKDVVLAEAWLVQFQQFREIQEECEKQEFQILVTLFEQLIIFLNRQPLFSQYQRNSKMKNIYSLEYQLNIQNQQKWSSTFKNSLSIVDLNHKHTKERVCRSFLIRIQCYYLDSLLDSLMGSANLGKQGKQKKEQTSTAETKVRGERSEIEDSSRNRKISVYEFYDKDLDFVFLSSDDETFKKSPKSDVKQINISDVMGLDDDDQFQMLIISKDEQFMDDNKATFSEMTQNETNYLTF